MEVKVSEFHRHICLSILELSCFCENIAIGFDIHAIHLATSGTGPAIMTRNKKAAVEKGMLGCCKIHLSKSAGILDFGVFCGEFNSRQTDLVGAAHSLPTFLLESLSAFHVILMVLIACQSFGEAV